MSAALKRRFNFVTVPVVEDLEQEIRIVTKREAELRTDYQVGVEPPAELAKLLVTLFQELRAGVTKDGKTKVKPPASVLSTAEAISVLFNSGDPGAALRQREGDAGRAGALARRRGRQGGRRGPQGACASTARRSPRRAAAPWKEFYAAGQDDASRERTSTASRACTSSRCATTRRAPSAVLRGFLDDVQPEVVLIEGPADADRARSTCSSTRDRAAGGDPRLPHRRDAGLLRCGRSRATRPSTWRCVGATHTAAGPRSSTFPSARALASHDREHADIDDAGGRRGRGRRGARSLDERSVRRARAASAPSRSSGRPRSRRPRTTPTAFASALLAYADLVRSDDRDTLIIAPATRSWPREIEARSRGRAPPSRLRSSLGAAHAAAFVAGDVDRCARGDAAAAGAVAVTRHPVQLPAPRRAARLRRRQPRAALLPARPRRRLRLPSRHPRGAGRLHRAPAAARLRRLARRHDRGVPAGDAARRHPRQGRAPGLDEVREAAIATMCRGDAAHVDAFLWPAVVGSTSGGSRRASARTRCRRSSGARSRRAGCPAPTRRRRSRCISTTRSRSARRCSCTGCARRRALRHVSRNTGEPRPVVQGR